MNRTPELEPDMEDDASFVTLPRPMPRWLQRLAAIHRGVLLAIVGAMLLLIAAGTVVWAIGRVTGAILRRSPSAVA